MLFLESGSYDARRKSVSSRLCCSSSCWASTRATRTSIAASIAAKRLKKAETDEALASACLVALSKPLPKPATNILCSWSSARWLSTVILSLAISSAVLD
mmetsp:Transcript_102/g.356  ORF Transcript_102/g.356 Transcript_102/m.356 type:complete len:100 (+) Transcript_102:199-498(+)